MPRRLAVSLALSSALLVVAAAAQPGGRAFPVLPLAVTVATLEGAPAVSDAWIETQVTNANALFSPHGVRFRLVERHTMPERHARLETRRDRHALGGRMHPQRIDWFVVHSLRDVDEPDRMRQGVHWRPRGAEYPARAHFVITSSIAGETVLAHELGHFFGNGHSDVPGNIMSYDRGDVPPFFDATQAARIRFSLRRFLSRGELLPAEELTD